MKAQIIITTFTVLHDLLPSPQHLFVLSYPVNSLCLPLCVLFSNPTGLLTLPFSSCFLFPQISEWSTLSLFLNSLCTNILSIMFSIRVPFTFLSYPTPPLDTPYPFNLQFLPIALTYYFYNSHFLLPSPLECELHEAGILTVLFTDIPSGPSTL